MRGESRESLLIGHPAHCSVDALIGHAAVIGVRREREIHSRSLEERDGFPSRFPGAEEALADRGRPVRKFRYSWLREKDAERRNDPAAKLSAARILTSTHEKAVLDAVDTLFQALIDAQAAISVRGHFETEPMGLLDAGRELLRRHNGKRRISVSPNKAAVKTLDEVRSSHDVVADRGPHIVG